MKSSKLWPWAANCFMRPYWQIPRVDCNGEYLLLGIVVIRHWFPLSGRAGSDSHDEIRMGNFGGTVSSEMQKREEICPCILSDEIKCLLLTWRCLSMISSKRRSSKIVSQTLPPPAPPSKLLNPTTASDNKLTLNQISTSLKSSKSLSPLRLL